MPSVVGVVRKKTLSDILELYLDLVCNKNGDERVLINCRYKTIPNYKNSLFGLFLLEAVFDEAG
ncbi:MAG: hypothetical protein IJT36_08185 [Alphaproteobacteria bacterium]|nr:hypothetical protein [Alphaproteobacteria bacterium]